jgi:hypothetical protein
MYIETTRYSSNYVVIITIFRVLRSIHPFFDGMEKAEPRRWLESRTRDRPYIQYGQIRSPYGLHTIYTSSGYRSVHHLSILPSKLSSILHSSFFPPILNCRVHFPFVGELCLTCMWLIINGSSYHTYSHPSSLSTQPSFHHKLIN